MILIKFSRIFCKLKLQVLNFKIIKGFDSINLFSPSKVDLTPKFFQTKIWKIPVIFCSNPKVSFYIERWCFFLWEKKSGELNLGLDFDIMLGFSYIKLLTNFWLEFSKKFWKNHNVGVFNFFLVEMDSIPSTTLGVSNIWEFDNCNSGFQKKFPFCHNWTKISIISYKISI